MSCWPYAFIIVPLQAADVWFCYPYSQDTLYYCKYTIASGNNNNCLLNSSTWTWYYEQNSMPGHTSQWTLYCIVYVNIHLLDPIVMWRSIGASGYIIDSCIIAKYQYVSGDSCISIYLLVLHFQQSTIEWRVFGHFSPNPLHYTFYEMMIIWLMLNHIPYYKWQQAYSEVIVKVWMSSAASFVTIYYSELAFLGDSIIYQFPSYVVHQAHIINPHTHSPFTI